MNKPVVCSDTFICLGKCNDNNFRLFESDLGCRYSYAFIYESILYLGFLNSNEPFNFF